VERQTIVVTGAGHGIGAATAHLLARQDVNLVLADIREDWLTATVSACSANGATIVPVLYDQRLRRDVDRLIGSTHDQFGRIDALVNVVGVYPNHDVATMSDELWDDVIATNLTGVFHCCRAALAVMLPAEAGTIVNISSPKARVPGHGFAAYAASKGGVEAFSRTLALEAAPHVRVNTVSPGGPIVSSEDQARDGARFDGQTDGVPLGRLGEPQDIAKAIAFLISPQASFITGQVIRVDGGRNMG
jgi:NAD(P)-dependent dehydrogenase (short-subunit alcohol dehydrogenase family)